MKYHTLFFSKIGKDVAKFAAAAVVIGALRVNWVECCVIFLSLGIRLGQ